MDSLTGFDAEGNPTQNEAETVRVTVTADGIVRSEVAYFDADGNPTSQRGATKATATTYDETGRVLSVQNLLDDDYDNSLQR
jgi:YD repeat-containing protein